MIAPVSLGHAQQEVHAHRLGDGLHPLPVYSIDSEHLGQLSSEGAILLLFLCWAQERDIDAVEFYARANSDKPLLRPDQLLIFRGWTELPDDRIETAALCRDLQAIGEHRLIHAINEIEHGCWHPPRAFTHWVVTDSGEGIAGEARDLDPPDQPDDQGQHFCFVRLFAMPDLAEWGYSNARHLVRKQFRGKEADHATEAP